MRPLGRPITPVYAMKNYRFFRLTLEASVEIAVDRTLTGLTPRFGWPLSRAIGGSPLIGSSR